MDFRIIKKTDFLDDIEVIDQMKVIIQTSYKEFDILNGLLQRELEDCNEIYLTKDATDKIVAFFMVGLKIIENQFFYYLGLSACKDGLKNNGLGKSMYLRFANDLKTKEKELGEKITCYWTTVTPIVYYWFCKNFIDVQPDINGYCRPERAEQIKLIVSAKYKKANWDKDYPYILRGAVSNFKFNDEEKNRIAKAITDINLNVFEKYKLDETNGDRFLMTGFVP